MKKTIKILVLVITLFLLNSQSVSAEEYKVLFEENITEETAANILEPYNIKEENPEIGYYIIESENVEAIEDDSNLEDMTLSETTEIKPPSLDDNEVLTSLPMLWEAQWDMHDITNNGKSYNLHDISQNTTIAVIDSGIDLSHHEFTNNIIDYKNFVPKGGYKNTEPTEPGSSEYNIDKTGHGTAVAGQISANNNLLGVAPGINIRSYRVFGGSSAEAEWIIDAIIEAAKDDNDVINLSAGQYLMKNGKYSDGTNHKIELKAYKRAIDFAFSKGSVVVSALGNDGLDLTNNNLLIDHLGLLTPSSQITNPGKVLDVPSNFNKTVAVGSSNIENEISNFSNYGIKKVDILAPSGSTKKLGQHGLEKFIQEGMILTDFIITAHPNNSYSYNVGTSFSAAKVSATIGLIIDKYSYQDQPQKAINHLLSSSDNIGEYNYLNIYQAISKY